MGSDSKGLLSRMPAEERLNVYALVIYIPDPLGRFLDDLRRELVPGCNPHAHVSVLPPRPLPANWHLAGERVQAFTATRPPFPVELGEIRMFPVTNVIYIEVTSGREELFAMHDGLNGGALAFDEPFVYHPHVTLAQEIPPGQVQTVHELAQRRWREFQGSRVFQADRAAFVQNTMGNCWIDLAECDLGGADSHH
jgi:2'-5' RNA ligase